MKIKNIPQLPKAALAAAALLAVFSGNVHAQTIFWTGSAGTDWSNSNNWSSNDRYPGIPTNLVNGNTLVFRESLTGGNPINRTNNNDIVGLSVATIQMNSGDPSYTLNGNQLTLTGQLNGGGSGTNTVNLDFQVAGNNMQFTGSETGGLFTINGVISEDATSRAIFIRAGEVVLTGLNSFSGAFVLGSNVGPGLVTINTLANSGVNQSLGRGTQVDFGSGSSSGAVNYTGGATSTNKTFRIGGPTTATGGGAFLNNGSGAVTWAGTQLLRTNSTESRTFTLGGTNTDNNTWSSIIGNNNTAGGGTIGITKEGAGTWILSGANTYTDATTVSEGTLLINGSTAAGSAVTVDPNGTLGGIGTIGGTLFFHGDSGFRVADINDALTVDGTVTFGTGFGIDNLSGIDWASLNLNTGYTLISTTQTFSDFDNIDNFGLVNAVAVGGGRSAYFDSGSLQLVVIPEPGTLALMGMAGLALLAGLRRRK